MFGKLLIVLGIFSIANVFAINEEKCFDLAMKLNSCCKMLEFDDGLKEKCGSQLEDEDPHQGGICFMECAFKEMDLINDDDSITKEKLLEVSEQYLAENDEADMAEVMEEAVNHCHGKYESKLEELKELQESGNIRCGPAPGFIGFCIHAYISSHCPETRWKPEGECDETKSEFTAECNE